MWGTRFQRSKSFPLLYFVFLTAEHITQIKSSTRIELDISHKLERDNAARDKVQQPLQYLLCNFERTASLILGLQKLIFLFFPNRSIDLLVSYLDWSSLKIWIFVRFGWRLLKPTFGASIGAWILALSRVYLNLPVPHSYSWFGWDIYFGTGTSIMKPYSY